MSAWSNNNAAHQQTWYSLVVLDQLAASFPEAESMTVADLTFWSGTASDELRRQQSVAISVQLDNMFTKVWKATYEAGADRDAALASLEGKLGRAETTIPELAAEADALYRFLGEPDHA